MHAFLCVGGESEKERTRIVIRENPREAEKRKRFRYCPNNYWTQPNITKAGFDTKLTLHHHPPANDKPPPGTQHHQYLSCYWSDFDQTFKVSFWDQQQQYQQQQQRQQPKWEQQQQYLNCNLNNNYSNIPGFIDQMLTSLLS